MASQSLMCISLEYTIVQTFLIPRPVHYQQDDTHNCVWNPQASLLENLAHT
jgi:hypothetical protein